MAVVAKRANFILVSLITSFAVSYVVFSSLATSLDFKMDRLLKQQTTLSEEYDLAFADTVKARSRPALLAAKDSLGLVEIVLAEGYVEVSPGVGGVSRGIVLKP
ncbi:MAG: hypothetical protein AAB642_00030 [Patescibacteria group bacterium]